MASAVETSTDDRAERDERGRFLPGHAPTPGGGRPKGSGWKGHVERRLAAVETNDLKTVGERVADVVVNEALDGERWACELLASRLWPAKSELRVDNDLPLLLVQDYCEGVVREVELGADGNALDESAESPQTTHGYAWRR